MRSVLPIALIQNPKRVLVVKDWSLFIASPIYNINPITQRCLLLQPRLVSIVSGIGETGPENGVSGSMWAIAAFVPAIVSVFLMPI